MHAILRMRFSINGCALRIVSTLRTAEAELIRVFALAKQEVKSVALRRLNYSWVMCVFQGALLIFSAYWLWRPPSPGIAVACLAGAAVYMTIRADKWGAIEKSAWLLLALSLVSVETRAIHQDHVRLDASAAEARRQDNQHFEEILKSNQADFAATMQSTKSVLEATQKVNALARENLAQVTGGHSYAYVMPVFDERNSWRASLLVVNTNSSLLTNVSMTLARPTGPDMTSHKLIQIGTISPYGWTYAPLHISPTIDPSSGEDSYLISIYEQNGIINEVLTFRRSTKNPHALAYKASVSGEKFVVRSGQVEPRIKMLFDTGWSPDEDRPNGTVLLHPVRKGWIRP